MPKAAQGRISAQREKKFYAVRAGRKPGVYENWADAEKQIDGFRGAHYSSFPTRAEAEQWTNAPNDNGVLSEHSLNTLSSSQLSPPPPTSSPVSGRTVLKSTSLSQVKAEASPPPAQHNLGKSTFSLEFQTAGAFLRTSQAVSATKKEADVAPRSPIRTTPKRQEVKVEVIVKVDESAEAGPSNNSPPEPTLSPQQANILDRVAEGQSVFFTGSAGVGKSFLLRAIIKLFKEREEAASQERERLKREWKAGRGEDPDAFAQNDKVMRGKLGITASTGVAAANIGGTTLHSWTGIGMGKASKESLYDIVQRYESAVTRWRTSEALIIDEISMIDGALLDKLDYIGREIRGNRKVPFGGLKLILCGDFFQLPPVSRKSHPPSIFAFQANCWKEIMTPLNMELLTRVFRQKDDRFVQLLEDVRKGRCSAEQVKMLERCARRVRYEHDAEPVGLMVQCHQRYPTRKQVKYVNCLELAKLQTQEYRFEAVDHCGIDSNGIPVDLASAKDRLDNDTVWPDQISLKVGAFVMLVTNVGVEAALVNGSTGRVIDFKTLEQARAEGIWVFSRGGKTLSPETPTSATAAFPVVRFDKSKHASGVQHDKVLIGPSVVDLLNADGGILASRVQVPLILAWALTVHKSQGQTIERLRVDFLSMFAAGQAYVALSRATSLENLEVKNFNVKGIIVSQEVLEWADSFESRQTKTNKVSWRRRAIRKL